MRSTAFLLQGALGYALDALGTLPPDVLGHATPCPGWDVRALVRHLVDGLRVLAGGRSGREAPPADDPVAAFTEVACLLLMRCHGPACDDTAAAVGAIEIAVHTWDVTRACGCTRPVPDLIAGDLLALAPRVVPAALRPALFAVPVRLSGEATPGDRLVAFLGRRPA
jgi:uncharacterized protein (TIGR03083 family)